MHVHQVRQFMLLCTQMNFKSQMELATVPWSDIRFILATFRIKLHELIGNKAITASSSVMPPCSRKCRRLWSTASRDGVRYEAYLAAVLNRSFAGSALFLCSSP